MATGLWQMKVICMIHLNGFIICAIDCETTGLDPEIHEIVEITFLPLDSNLDPRKDIPFFDIRMKPENEDSIDWNAFKVNKTDYYKLMQEGMDKWDAAELFVEWFEKLKLPPNKRIMPLAHNWAFDCEFVKKWLGPKTFHYHIDGRYRDTMVTALQLNDVADINNTQIPFPKVKLDYVASQLKIPHERAHTALGDCLVTAQVYKGLLRKNRLIN
jgi:DNA polymerase III epsilon subunit-like protein